VAGITGSKSEADGIVEDLRLFQSKRDALNIEKPRKEGRAAIG
jgi:hypothetical protein